MTDPLAIAKELLDSLETHEADVGWVLEYADPDRIRTLAEAYIAETAERERLTMEAALAKPAYSRRQLEEKLTAAESRIAELEGDGEAVADRSHTVTAQPDRRLSADDVKTMDIAWRDSTTLRSVTRPDPSEEVIEAAEYYIDRLKNAWLGKPVADMAEAESSFLAARKRFDAALSKDTGK